MNLIFCNDKCAYQQDGYCNYVSTSNNTLNFKDNCIHKKNPPPKARNNLSIK